jgi:hypothetical protein
MKEVEERRLHFPQALVIEKRRERISSSLLQ